MRVEQEANLRIAVLAGGESAEREVSLRSGASVATALRAKGHQAAIIDPAEEPLATVDWSRFDTCFIALHGGAGEDGRIQAELAGLGVAFTGSGSEACRLAMSKLASKQRFAAEGVPTPPHVWITADDSLAGISRRLKAFGYPLVVKPDDQGSSVGVAIAREIAELPLALAEARTYGGACLAEPLVRGREFTVAMLDDRALPLVEIVTPEELFSYEAKYHSSLTEYRFEFELADQPRRAIREAAIAAVRALGVEGLSRVDLMLDVSGAPWVLEVNTIPGMTERSLAPLAAALAGIEMPELCDLLVRRSLVQSGAV